MSIDAMDAEGDHDHEGETEDQVEGLKKNPHKHDSGAADLEKVTDYVEEQELASHVAQSVSDRLFKFFCFLPIIHERNPTAAGDLMVQSSALGLFR